MSLFGKNKICEYNCETCGRDCVLHRKHSEMHYCGTLECALQTLKFGSKELCNFPNCILSKDHFGVCEFKDGFYDALTASIPSSLSQESLSSKNDRRPCWHETWMQIAKTIGERSYDKRLKVGAIVVAEDNTTMIAAGYNGNGAGLPNIPDSDEPGESGFIHAEENCLIKCPYHYPVGKIMYVTHSPCKLCAKRILNAKIQRVVYDIEYRDTSGIDLLKSMGITVEKLSDLLLPK